MVVPQTGHLPLAMFIPVFETATSPSKSRFSLHLTQYPLYVWAFVATVSSSVIIRFLASVQGCLALSLLDTPTRRYAWVR